MNQTIKRSVVAGFTFLIVGTVLALLNSIKAYEAIGLPLILYVIVYISSLIFSIIFFWGFWVIGQKTQNLLLQIMSHFLIFFSIIFHVFFFQPPIPIISLIIFNPGLSFSIIILITIIGILLGISLIKLKKRLGLIAISSGVFQIIVSLFLLIIEISKMGINPNLLPNDFSDNILAISGYISLSLPTDLISNLELLTINLPIFPILLIVLAHYLQLILLIKSAKEFNN